MGALSGGSEAALAHAVPFDGGWLLAVAILDGQSSMTRFAFYQPEKEVLKPLARDAGSLMTFQVAVAGERAAVPRVDGASVLVGGEEVHFPLEDELQSVAIHPNGAQVAGTTVGDRVVVWGSPFEPPREATGVPGGQLTSLAFSPDGEKLIVSICGRGLAILDAESLAYESTLALSCVMLYSLAFSPDGEWIAVSGSEGEVYLIRLADAEVKVLSGHEPREVMPLAFSPDGEGPGRKARG